jgi:hypothetical protein
MTKIQKDSLLALINGSEKKTGCKINQALEDMVHGPDFRNVRPEMLINMTCTDRHISTMAAREINRRLNLN